MENKSLLSVVVPVYNEVKTIQTILDRIKKVAVEKEIIVVDDFSTDGTREILSQINDPQIRVVLKPKNGGKGSAVKEGIKAASGDYIIIQDADLEYDPEDFHLLLKAMTEKKGDVIYGSRFLGSSNFPSLSHKIGNKFLTLVTNLLYGSKITDMETCYKLIPAKIAKSLNIQSKKFDMEPEITAKILKSGNKIAEVPIGYKGRAFSEGKKISWKDAFSAIWTLVKYRF